MLYVQKGEVNTLHITIKEKAINSSVLNNRQIRITNSMTLEEKSVTINVNTNTNSRVDFFDLEETTADLENLAGGSVNLENGSHTYKIIEVNNSGQEFVVETGKLHVFTGTFTTETKFGSEVTTTEHTTTDTNTVYIKI